MPNVPLSCWEGRRQELQIGGGRNGLCPSKKKSRPCDGMIETEGKRAVPPGFLIGTKDNWIWSSAKKAVLPNKGKGIGYLG